MDVQDNRPGVFSVFGEKNGKTRFIGCWYSLSDAVGMASACAQQRIPTFDVCYVIETDAGEVFREERSYAMRRLDHDRYFR